MYRLCKKKRLYGLIVQLILSSIIAITIYLLAPTLATYYFKTPLATLPLRILSMYFVFLGISRILISTFKGFQLEKYWATAELVRILPTLIFSVLIFLKVEQNRLVWISAIWLTVILLRFLTYLIVLIKKFKFILREKFVHNPNLFSQMRVYSFGVLAAGGAGALLGNIDILLLTLLKTVKETAMYNIALPSVEIVMVLIAPLTNFLYPKPDYLFFLTGDHKKIQKRKKTFDISEVERQTKVYLSILKKSKNSMIINTSKDSKEKCLGKIILFINERKLPPIHKE